MDYIVNVTEANFSEVWQATQQIPVVFSFTSLQDVASIETDAMLRRLVDEYPKQFLLATVNCDEQRELAMQFRVQTLPTLYFFSNGQPIDMAQGKLSEQELRIRLANILPKEEELKFNRALELLQDERYEQALPLLKSAWELSEKKNSDFALLYAETFIVMKKTEEAKAVLTQIPIQDRDSRWQGLQAQIELLEQAAESPKLQQLQADYATKKTPEIAIRLANQLHQVGKNEEALTLLFEWLKGDLNASNGEVKSQFLAILSALGSDAIVPKFRRQLYSLLY
ncbi:co-chaperone YbbN [Haemophilus sputorum]|jgi:Thioredoxin domain-containing protein|uniref:Co-chaperone YbbN n=1 Tax=Haemophilus sputorum TaxID=1078480 RepID=A0ABX9HQP5_9PAST|nr:co-chaperone YbbN [Haemophilus sputorum]RDF07453.1 co-chaperone YbbN [Haemophilus sputorum]RDF11136.1 co-chaperone YbbN [Haemophilus sputorum]